MSYSFELLKGIHKQNVQSFMNQMFLDYNPLHQTLFKTKPEFKAIGLKMNYHFWTPQMENGIESDLSLVVLDKQNNNYLVGASLTFDITSQGYGLPQYNQESPIMGPVLSLFDKMKSLLLPKYQELFKQKGVVAQIFAVAVSPKYSGKKILNKMIEENLRLARQKNFKFAYLIAANPRTVTVVKKMGFNKILQMDAKQYVWNGEKVNQKMDENQRYISMWLIEL